MIVRSFKDIEGTDRHVKAASGTWESKRIVLAKERVGFSLHETVLYAGTETSMWYANHIEAVVCVEGEAELTDDETGRDATRSPPAPCTCSTGTSGTRCGSRTDFRCLCVFNPPVTGREDHDENGVYPLLTEPDPTSTPRRSDTHVTHVHAHRPVPHPWRRRGVRPASGPGRLGRAGHARADHRGRPHGVRA